MCLKKKNKETWVLSIEWLYTWTLGFWLLHWRNCTLLWNGPLILFLDTALGRNTGKNQPNTFKIYKLLLVKTKLTHEASKSNRPQETHKLEMEWRYQLVLFKGVRISMFLAATLAPSRLKQNLRHIVKIQLTCHTQRRRRTVCSRKGYYHA